MFKMRGIIYPSLAEKGALLFLRFLSFREPLIRHEHGKVENTLIHTLLDLIRQIGSRQITADGEITQFLKFQAKTVARDRFYLIPAAVPVQTCFQACADDAFNFGNQAHDRLFGAIKERGEIGLIMLAPVQYKPLEEAKQLCPGSGVGIKFLHHRQLGNLLCRNCPAQEGRVLLLGQKAFVFSVVTLGAATTGL